MRRPRYHRTKRSTQMGIPIANDGGIAQFRCACPGSCVRHRTSLRCTSDTIRVASMIGKQRRIANHDIVKRQIVRCYSREVGLQHPSISEQFPVGVQSGRWSCCHYSFSFHVGMHQHTTNLHHLFCSMTPVDRPFPQIRRCQHDVGGTFVTAHGPCRAAIQWL